MLIYVSMIGKDKASFLLLKRSGRVPNRIDSGQKPFTVLPARSASLREYLDLRPLTAH
jgi:hypothetical protein